MARNPCAFQAAALDWVLRGARGVRGSPNHVAVQEVFVGCSPLGGRDRQHPHRVLIPPLPSGEQWAFPIFMLSPITTKLSVFFMFICWAVSSVNLCLWSSLVYCWGLGAFLTDLYAFSLT